MLLSQKLPSYCILIKEHGATHLHLVSINICSLKPSGSPGAHFAAWGTVAFVTELSTVTYCHFFLWSNLKMTSISLIIFLYSKLTGKKDAPLLVIECCFSYKSWIRVRNEGHIDREGGYYLVVLHSFRRGVRCNITKRAVRLDRSVHILINAE